MEILIKLMIDGSILMDVLEVSGVMLLEKLRKMSDSVCVL